MRMIVTASIYPWSVTQSFLSTLIGIAIEEGLIDSIEDPAPKSLLDFWERD
jgi:Beta-lactamase class C and other penicillin binding proteins